MPAMLRSAVTVPGTSQGSCHILALVRFYILFFYHISIIIRLPGMYELLSSVILRLVVSMRVDYRPTYATIVPQVTLGRLTDCVDQQLQEASASERCQ